MSSPFPGMDPYLEGDLWTTVHATLAVEVARQLSPQLRTSYVALVQRKFVIDAGVDDKAVVAGGVTEAMPHHWVEVREVPSRDLMTYIEILSPASKRGRGREEYLAQRGRLLSGGAHYMEIDLLREGKRVPMRDPLPPAHYYVLLSRAGKRPATEVWPIDLRHPLPTVPVPLRERSPDVPLDLQLALTSIYDTFRYDLLIDYKQPPDIPLPPDAAAWAEEHLKAAGLRP